MANNRFSKTDELAEILDEYRNKKNQAGNSAKDGDAPKDAPTVALDPKTRVGLPAAEAASQPEEEEPVYTEVSEEVAAHFADIVSEHAEDPSSHFSDGDEDDETYLPEESYEEDEDEDEDEPGEYSHLPIVFRIFLHIGDWIMNMSFLLKAVLYIAVVLIIASYLSYYVLTAVNDVFALVTGESEVKVVVPEGATSEEIAALLAEHGLIDYEKVFLAMIELDLEDGEELTFISGEHTLNTSMNYNQLVSALTTPSRVREIVTLTIPEGFTVDDIIDLFVKNGVGTRDGFVKAINEYEYKHEFVQLLEEQGWSTNRVYRLEGYLYPDTYDFYTDTEEYLAINKLLNNFDDKVWDDWKSTYEPYCIQRGYTLDDIVTLSSMIEAEGKTAEDFEYISYVFHNRLTHSASFPKLESDATIQYALELAGLDRIQDSALIDVSFESPYNTYLYNGMPPGAICNAGLDAILAAIYPSPPYDDNDNEINAYYFVSNNAGQTYYAATVSGHERNKERVKRENAEMAEKNEDS